METGDKERGEGLMERLSDGLGKADWRVLCVTVSPCVIALKKSRRMKKNRFHIQKSGRPLLLKLAYSDRFRYFYALGVMFVTQSDTLRKSCTKYQAPRTIFYFLPCNPHSLLSGNSHHQRPARISSPGSMARVQGWQPILGKPCSCNLLKGMFFL